MLTKNPFYFGTTRKMVIAFAGLFSNLYTRTFDKDGVTQKIVKVPIAFANKEKFIVRLQQDAALNEDIQILLPRLSFEIVGFDSDSTRQLNKSNKSLGIKDGRSVYSYSPVPYNLSFNLYSFTKTQEDNLQILEQIVPYFTPDMNLTIKVMQSPDISQDCSLVLNSISPDDAYDGGFEDRRYIITTYSFVLKMNYYSPLLNSFDPENHFENSAEFSIIKKVQTNLNSNKYSATIDPFEANESDVYTIIECWSERDGGATDFDIGETV